MSLRRKLRRQRIRSARKIAVCRTSALKASLRSNNVSTSNRNSARDVTKPRPSMLKSKLNWSKHKKTSTPKTPCTTGKSKNSSFNIKTNSNCSKTLLKNISHLSRPNSMRKSPLSLFSLTKKKLSSEPSNHSFRTKKNSLKTGSLPISNQSKRNLPFFKSNLTITNDNSHQPTKTLSPSKTTLKEIKKNSSKKTSKLKPWTFSLKRPNNKTIGLPMKQMSSERKFKPLKTVLCIWKNKYHQLWSNNKNLSKKFDPSKKPIVSYQS